MKSIDVILKKVVFEGPARFGSEGGISYVIARTLDGTSIKGQMRRPAEGVKYRLWGEMRPQKGGHGDAFEFSSYEPLCDRTNGGIALYLSKHVPEIGPIRARALLKKFGPDTLDILRSDANRATELPGFTEKMAEAIGDHFRDTANRNPSAMARVAELVEGCGFPARLPELAVRSWGSAAADVIKDNPYMLVRFPRVGWKLTDPFAIDKVGFPRDGLERHVAAIYESMIRIVQDGHTCASMAEMMNGAEGLIGGQAHPDALASAMEDKISGHEDDSGISYQPSHLADSEANIARRLVALGRHGPPPIAGLVSDDWAAECTLGDDQVAAAKWVESQPISVITGPPGTGKSFLVSRIILRLRRLGHKSIRCVAPTGKAAKRLKILLSEVGIEDVPSTTIHRALEPSRASNEEEGVAKDDAKFGRGRDSWGFNRHEFNPIDEKIIVIEETSMIDVKIMSALLSACALGSRLILVGDEHQLQSVGPGAVLRDLRAAGIPTTSLAQIRRSDSAGTVVHACHAIIRGEPPRHADRLNAGTAENWIHLQVEDPDEIANTIVRVNANLKTFDRIWDVQVISPQKERFPFGCDNLNRLLARALNPENHEAALLTDPISGAKIDVSDKSLRIGDKVVRTKNGQIDELTEIGEDSEARLDFEWDDREWSISGCAVVNGDMGQVVDVLRDRRSSLIVSFRDPTRLCRLPLYDKDIMLAFATTVHKMQGSGARVVIAPVHRDFYFDDRTNKGLWNRELFYTMISRTMDYLVTVGDWSAALLACSRATVGRRRTTLVSRISREILRDEETDGIRQPDPSPFGYVE